jgi:dCTP deaminase
VIGPLPDFEIRRLIEEGYIGIDPAPDFEAQLGPCSLDLHLGETFRMFKVPNAQTRSVDIRTADMDEFTEVSASPKGVILLSGGFVLATTQERVTLPADIRASLDGRSSIGRWGATIHATACGIRPGFSGTITLEVYNQGPLPLTLTPGMRFCALEFTRLAAPVATPYHQQPGAKYTNQTGPAASRLQED